MALTIPKETWVQYLIACVIVSIGALIIHAAYNTPANFSLAFSWLPVVWVLVFALMMVMSVIVGGEE